MGGGGIAVNNIVLTFFWNVKTCMALSLFKDLSSTMLSKIMLP